MTKRIVLPRRESSRYDSVEFVKKSTTTYSDQNTITFQTSTLGSLIDMPSGLPVNFVEKYGGFKNVDRTNDLIDSLGIFVTGTVKSSNFDRFISVINDPMMSASSVHFDEANIYNESQATSSPPFFSTGSSFRLGDGSLNVPLSHKQRIKKVFTVTSQTSMLRNTSSLYYFDCSSGLWSIQQKSNPASEPLQKLSISTTSKAISQTPQTLGSWFLEDAIGFDVYGNPVASGSLDILRSGTGIKQTISGSGESRGRDTFSSAVQMMSALYPKSVQQSSVYDASTGTCFSLDIDRPFAVEKAVIEVPLKIGADWFRDKTVTLPVTGSGGDYVSGSTGLGQFSFIDSGGPAITLALFCQKNNGKTKTRDLVLNSVLTHNGDSPKLQALPLFKLTSSGLTSRPQTWCIVVNGTSNVSGSWTVISSNSSNSSFTGSVAFQGSSQTTNGTKMIYSGSFIYSGSSYVDATTIGGPKTTGAVDPSFMSSLYSFLNNPTISSKYAAINNSIVPTTIDAIGRGMSGFEQGSSPFGREHVTFTYTSNGGNIPNPFYISSDEAQRFMYSETNFSGSWSGTPSNVMGIANTSVGTSVDSPYLIYPGDSLLLAISKNRPAFGSVKGVNVSTGATVPLDYGKFTYTSSSYYNSMSVGGHDVTMDAGIISVTLYGSYLGGNAAYRGQDTVTGPSQGMIVDKTNPERISIAGVSQAAQKISVI
jgi:hypothetical protein